MLQEFKDFINKGNVIDLAVAVVLGAAFAPVVKSLVDRILMPLIGLLVGSPNFDTIGTFACEEGLDPATSIINSAGATCAGSVGAVLTVIVNFILIALAVFLVVKAYNATKDPEPEAAPPADPEELLLLRQIRDGIVNR